MAETAAAAVPPKSPAQQPAPAQPKVRVIEVAPTPRPARMRPRHWMVMASFLLFVMLPVAAVGLYLYTVAADQYASRVGFTVRTEETSSALDLLGGLSSLGGSSSSDTDILYEFIQSQEMVRAAEQTLDLRAIWRPQGDALTGSLFEPVLGRVGDPVFELPAGANIEELVDYWQRMVRLFYDPNTGLIEVEVRAFAPDDAQAVARLILARSGEVINTLTTVAREDVLGYAREELDDALEGLRVARQALTQFRNETQIVDVGADLQGQMGLLSQLQGQLAEALVELDLLAETASSTDPRVAQAQRRIDAIQRRIAEERAKVGGGGVAADGRPYAELAGEFESLQVDLKFAEESYLSARAAFDSTVAEARRQNRYLAAYLQPTLSETPQYPRRGILLGLTALILSGVWIIAVLVFYSLKDRR